MLVRENRKEKSRDHVRTGGTTSTSSSDATSSPQHAEAKRLARFGYRVFPLHHADAFGACSCKKSACGSVAKHPRIADWPNKATTDQSEIDEWWQQWPEANIGLATGDGLVVLDLDSEEAEADAERLGTPDTVSVKTGRGRHLYFKGIARNHIGIRKGIDVRGEGGYVVAPPSIHATGHEYSWIVEPDHDLAPLPGWVSKKAKPTSSRTKGKAAGATSEPESIPEGERNDTLFKLGCTMRGAGFYDAEIAAALDAANGARCRPPLQKEEVRRVAEHAASYPYGRLIDQTVLALGLGANAVAVYLALRTSANHKAVCERSLDGIAGQVGIHRTTVKKAVDELERCGLIKKTRQAFGPNRYKLIDFERE